jgi:hypothetical protein
MLHVIVKTPRDGNRRAWYINSIVVNNEILAIVVFKNNDKERIFTPVSLNSVSLDLNMKNPTTPIVDSLRSINTKLKNTGSARLSA